LSYQWWREL